MEVAMGDTTQTDPGSKTGEGGNEPEFVTVAQLNSAITARLKAFETKQAQSFTELKTAHEASTTELKSLLEAALPKGQQPASGGNGEVDPQKVIENSPAYRGMKKAQEDLHLKIRELETARQEEARKARDATLDQRVSNLLGGGGVESKRLDAALTYLRGKSMVRHTEDGQPVFVEKDGEVDLETGLKGWLKSEEATIYLPARNTQGSGTRPGAAPASAGQKQGTDMVGLNAKLDAALKRTLQSAG